MSSDNYIFNLVKFLISIFAQILSNRDSNEHKKTEYPDKKAQNW